MAYIGIKLSEASSAACLYDKKADSFLAWNLGAFDPRTNIFRPLGAETRGIQTLDDTLKIVQEDIDGAVIVTPEGWELDGLKAALREMGSMQDEDILFVSGAAAAAHYGCKDGYTGYLVLVEGDPLTVSLCKAGKDQIEILSQWDSGGANFDGSVVRHLAKRLDGEDPKALCRAFAQEKLSSAVQIDQSLREYCISGGLIDQAALTLSLPGGKYQVMAADLVEAFDTYCGGLFEKALDELLAYCGANGIDVWDMEGFRVLLTGDFVGLRCAENAVRKRFGSSLGLLDPRFENGVDLEKRSAAAIRGAALWASELDTGGLQCPAEIGLSCYDCYGRERNFPLVCRGRMVKDCRKPVYIPAKFYRDCMDEEPVITLDFCDGTAHETRTLTGLTFPNFQDMDNFYQIGMSLTRSGAPVLHIKDRSGLVGRHPVPQPEKGASEA